MASKKHQFLLRMLITQVHLAQFKVYYVDGKVIAKIDNTFMPPKIIRHRPDALGVSSSGQVCICDAKTEIDILCKRTEEQLIDFTSIELNGFPCQVFIAIPRSAEKKMHSLLTRLHLTRHKDLHILKVPDEIINE